MRKRLTTPIPQDAPPRNEGWLALDGAAVLEEMEYRLRLHSDPAKT
jgi:hypothetical protein